MLLDAGTTRKKTRRRVVELRAPDANPGLSRVEHWFRAQRWTPFEFQRDAWSSYLRAESGLLHAPTGAGKTLAVWLGPLIEWINEHPEHVPSAPPLPATAPARSKRRALSEPLRVLWITPLRALAADTASSLHEAVEALALPWSVELRTGDTSAHVKRRQRQRLPSALVTTPESLSLLLSYPDALESLASLRCIVIDEWHELLGTKRGVQTELAISRLKSLAPNLRTWGLSATLGNLEEATAALLGNPAARAAQPAPRLLSGHIDKQIDIHTFLPSDMERFPWAGHLGTRMLPAALDAIAAARTTLLFTNTRSQAELWFQSILRARPEWTCLVALHHGSLDRSLRERVESLLASGALRCVVCTSSLDLGVDFAPVEQVIQVGSPKGVARLQQRAGRSGHQPGSVSRALCVPTHAFELVEFAAAREAMQRRELEARRPLDKPLDVLVQHLVTLALAGASTEAQALAEVRSTHSYRDLTDQQWRWAMDFVTRGGPSLTAYPQFARVALRDSRLTVGSAQIAHLHRMSVGTITSDASVSVRFRSGASLGSVEESFISRLAPGDRFIFAGRTLELLQFREMTATVRPSKARGSVPRWGGAKMPLSTQLASSVRAKLDDARRGIFEGPEMRAVRPVLDIQAAWSRIPAPSELLIERAHTRDGFHTFIYPFEGRLAHEGLAALAVHRLIGQAPRTITFAMNDYGFALISSEEITLDEPAWRRIFSTDRLIEDLLDCINTVALARRAFRSVARIAGLIFPGFPGAPKAARHLQASSELFFEVFSQYDPSNLLLDQARREVLERELEIVRLRSALERMSSAEMCFVDTPNLTPLSFPIWTEFLQAQATSESWIDRVRKMSVLLEAAAGAPSAAPVVAQPTIKRKKRGARRVDAAALAR